MLFIFGLFNVAVSSSDCIPSIIYTKMNTSTMTILLVFF